MATRTIRQQASATSAEVFRMLPGVVAVRRDDTRLQLGLDPPGRVIAPDTAAVRRLLAELAHGCPVPDDPEARRTLTELRDAGLVRGATVPLAAVRVEASPELTRVALALLGETDATDPAVVLVIDEAPVPRERLDPLMRDGVPHLIVSGGPDAWTVGPFVVPGVTACLRCVDAALAEEDPRRPVVVDQLTRRAPRPLPDPLLRGLALPCAAREVLTFLQGDRPASWSTTMTFRRTGATVERSWGRHPHCGCAWDVMAYR